MQSFKSIYLVSYNLILVVLIVKPKHCRYALHKVNNETYVKYAIGYSNAKKYGIRGIYSYLTGIGLWGVAREVIRGNVVQYGKRRLATAVIGAATWMCAPAVAVLTNSTKVLNITKRVYMLVCWTGEAIEDSSNVSFLLLDMAIFGQAIPIGDPNRFDIWSKITDIGLD